MTKTKISLKRILIYTVILSVKRVAVAVALVATLFACDQPQDIGLASLVPVATYYTDTLTVRTSTVIADSVRTENPDVFLVGRAVDPLLGTVEASSYFRVNVSKIDLGTNFVYDSLELLTSYRFAFGDTIREQEVAIHRLTESIDVTKKYYNTSQVAYDPTPLGKRTFIPRPVSNGVLRFRISDELGREIAGLSGKTEGSTNDEFQKVIKGFVMKGARDNTSIIGFRGAGSGVALRLHYRTIGTTADTVARTIDLLAVAQTATGGTVRAGFNRVIADRTGTAFAGLKPLTRLPASATNGQTFVQDAAGLTTKIEIPYLKSLNRGSPVAINRAQLTIRPVQNTASAQWVVPPFLTLIETDATNRVLRDEQDNERIINADNLALSPTFPQTAQVVPFNRRSRDYTFLLTTHLQAMLTGRKQNDGFLVAPLYTSALGQGNTFFRTQLNNSLNQMILGSGPEHFKLIVFYTEGRE